MRSIRCNCCGRELPEGSTKYIVEIRSFADYEGYIEDCEGDVEGGINDILDAVENMDPDTLDDDVYQVSIFVLCKECRSKFANDPFRVGDEVCEMGDEIKGTIH